MADGGACSSDPFRLPCHGDELTYPFGNGLVVRYGYSSRLVSSTVAVAGVGAEFPPPTQVCKPYGIRMCRGTIAVVLLGIPDLLRCVCLGEQGTGLRRVLASEFVHSAMPCSELLLAGALSVALLRGHGSHADHYRYPTRGTERGVSNVVMSGVVEIWRPQAPNEFGVALVDGVNVMPSQAQ